ncbi:MAG: putative DNA binding domain-containing protein [Propionibacteriaceae bacterium]|jgi:ATP-dependent DNA helicase RecG|nr:putative DNA binding domain-containing protein [Propionibacteriaceae bacterium]
MQESVESALALEPAEAIEALIHMPEDQWFDRKSGRIQAKDLAVPLVAFGNAEGGYLVVGIHNGAVDSVTPDRASEIRQAALDFTEPPVKMSVSELRDPNGQLLLILRIESGRHVHVTSKGECYLRVGDESRRLTFTQQKELDYDLGTSSFDIEPVDADLADLDQEACSAYQRLIGASSIESALRARGLLTRDGRVTVAAWLLFADHPGQLFPSAHVRVLKYADRERGTGSRMTLMAGHDIRFDGPLAEQITKATQLVNEWIPNLTRLADDGRFKDTPIIPDKAWEEGLINAVVHRSYSMHGDHIRVEIFPNRIEISNPGRFPGVTSLRDPMSVVRFARNPRIARVLADMGIARELGEGIRRMFEHMETAGLTDPIYQQSSMGVKLTLLDQPLPAALRDALPKKALTILTVLQEAGRPLSTAQVTDAAGMSRPTVTRLLKQLRDNRAITWDGQSARDPHATWRARREMNL